MAVTRVRTMGQMNCHPTYCGMLVEIGEDGRALSASGDPDEPELWIHPIDAAARAVQSGRAIDLYNERGAFRAIARVTEDVLPGVVWMRDGWPGLDVLTSGAACLSPHASEGLDARIPGGQAAFEARVEVRHVHG